MNKTLKDLLGNAGVSSVDALIAPIMATSEKLRELAKAKADEATRLGNDVAILQAKIVNALDEADRANRIADQLDGLVL